MIPESLFLPLPRLGFLTRLMMQFTASALLTSFYTPGGAAGWILDLALRAYLTVTRRLPMPLPAMVRSFVRVPRIRR